jgi:hypothetical protein
MTGWRDNPGMTLRQEREERIRTARDLASHLLETVSDARSTEQVQLAIRDLDTAETWLGQPAIESRPSIIQAVDSILEFVRRRLVSVDPTMVEKYGPNFETIG